MNKPHAQFLNSRRFNPYSLLGAAAFVVLAFGSEDTDSRSSSIDDIEEAPAAPARVEERVEDEERAEASASPEPPRVIEKRKPTGDEIYRCYTRCYDPYIESGQSWMSEPCCLDCGGKPVGFSCETP